MEPCGLAQLPHGLQAEEGVALHAPSALAAQHAGEDVGNRIDIGRDVESPPEQIVTGVDHQRDFFSRHDLAQAIDKFCAAGAATEDADHAALRARPSSPVAVLSFSESNPGLASSGSTNSGYTGSRWRNTLPLASVRSCNCSMCGHGFSGLMKSGVSGEIPPQSLMPASINSS